MTLSHNVNAAVAGTYLPKPAAKPSLSTNVLAGDYCIGCGVCAAVPGSALEMRWTRHGLLCARMRKGIKGDDQGPLRVCPFSGVGPNETDIARSLYGAGCSEHPAIGFYSKLYAGRVADESVASLGSSGAIGRWLLSELLRTQMIDGVVHVVRHHVRRSGEPLYSYTIEHNPNAMLHTAQSSYYPVDMSTVLADLRRRNGRYAITGLPCFIKAVRLLCREDAAYAERIRFCIGLICGHLKSRRYAEMIGWQLGVRPPRLARLDFRRKLSVSSTVGRGLAAFDLADESTPGGVGEPRNLFGTDYGWGFFKPNACEYCDDVFAETADIAIGDAWLPRYATRGTSLVVARHPALAELLDGAVRDKRLHLDEVSSADAVSSQAAGLRHRRDGLRYRLYLKSKQQQWCPPKRCTPSYRHLKQRRRRLYDLRSRISAESHVAFMAAMKAGNLDQFIKRMMPLIDEYKALQGGWLGAGLYSLLTRSPWLVALYRRFRHMVW